MKNIFKKGDTIIEVTLAISIFAMLMVGSLALMNAGLSRSQATMQLTMARSTIDAQAEALRFMNNAYIAQHPRPTGEFTGPAREWLNATSASSTSASRLNECRSDFNPTNILVVDTVNMAVRKSGNGANFTKADTYPRLSFGVDNNTISIPSSYLGARGVWVEAVRPSGLNAKYYDFHIRACWMPSGSNVETTLGTIVRLYDPR
ncbi:MAG: hypothetical protein KIG14_01890 [Candidatus Sacchiramonaceae bacterium]|nr:hypothetical protein [Candidatus Saccharimonadaceae bacterium]